MRRRRTKTLDTIFETRLASEQNAYMLGNLAVIAEAHAARPYEPTASFKQASREYQVRSGIPGSDGIIVDRPAELLAEHHGVKIGQLVAFAAGGSVVDIGAGRSSFLDAFSGQAETTAVDLRASHTVYQLAKGHKALNANASDLAELSTGSVRLLNAAYSVPFWSVSEQEAADSAREFTRVLEPGGVGLVGPIARHDEHDHYEYAVEVIKYRTRSVLPWSDPNHAGISQVWNAFTRTLLATSLQGDLEHGYLDIVGSRFKFDSGPDFKEDAYDIHVPNYLMFRKS